MCPLFLILTGFLTIQCAAGGNFFSNSVGVIDLRPKLSPDRIHLIDNPIVGKAIFPAIQRSEDDCDLSYEDVIYDQQAAAAYCVGSQCSKVYLIVAYDFENEKTVLHRAFGGTKLMSFVDGTRKYWENSRRKTKLVLLLVPSSTSSENQLKSFLSSKTETTMKIHDLTKNAENNPMLRGAILLLDRLRKCFEYGGEEYDDVGIFQHVHILCAGSNLDPIDDSSVDDLILKHQGAEFDNQSTYDSRSEVLEHFKEVVISLYKSADGSGNINFVF